PAACRWPNDWRRKAVRRRCWSNLTPSARRPRTSCCSDLPRSAALQPVRARCCWWCAALIPFPTVGAAALAQVTERVRGRRERHHAILRARGELFALCSGAVRVERQRPFLSAAVDPLCCD